MRKINKVLCVACSTLFGAGYFPIASGTVGSLVTMPFAIAVAYYYGFYGMVISTIVLFFIGVYTTHYTTQGTKNHDPSCVVIDEAMGQFCTFIPVANYLQYTMEDSTITLYFLGFFFFRLFDTLKPQPARWADKDLHSAWGVMLDDLFAGIYASISIYFLYVFFWR